jgi:hypothetical protein
MAHLRLTAHLDAQARQESSMTTPTTRPANASLTLQPMVVPVSMMLPPKVSRSTIAVLSR